MNICIDCKSEKEILDEILNEIVLEDMENTKNELENFGKL